ncbi:pyruvate/2-oxoglutarate dehydrogenase complex dihydrolipoamide acyltransferase (E2) component, partial [Variovorax paradoxus]
MRFRFFNYCLMKKIPSRAASTIAVKHALVLISAFAASGAALAQTATTDAAAAPAAAPAPNLTGNVSITTNY